MSIKYRTRNVAIPFPYDILYTKSDFEQFLFCVSEPLKSFSMK